MNALLTLLVSIRAAALALSVSGDQRSGDGLYAVADAIEAGKATDDHMQLIADKLKERDLTQADWDDVLARIDDDHAKLQSGS
jgi:hypothetical protein